MGYLERMANCPCLSLRKASRVVTALFNEEMAESGVLITQLPLLGALKVEGALPLTRLAEALDMDRTTLSRNLNPLLRLGWVAESPGRDRRSRMLEITSAGAAALEKALPLWDRAQEKVKALWGEPETAALVSTLKAIG